MRLASLLLPTSFVVLASGACAQELPYVQPDPTTTSTVQVTAPARPVYLNQQQERDIEGTYVLSNGWRMNVRTETAYIDAAIGRQKSIRLDPVGEDRFVSRDGSVTMQFNQGLRGEDMTMRSMPDGRLAQVVVLTARLAQR